MNSTTSTSDKQSLQKTLISSKDSPLPPVKAHRPGAPDSASKNSPLGITAKVAFCRPTLPNSESGSARRFRLQRASRRLMWSAEIEAKNIAIRRAHVGKDTPKAKEIQQERVCYCCRQRAPFVGKIAINRSPDGRASYSGLYHCASIWACPVCAAAITEKRRRAVSELIRAAKLRGYGVALATYTLRHHKGDRLIDLLVMLLQAYRMMKSGGSVTRSHGWAGFAYEHGWAGSIRCLEVTYGDNGWHVHIHELVFFSPDVAALVNLDTVQSDLADLWIAALRKCGGSADVQHGVKVQDGNAADKYVAKWGLEHELTKAPTKRAGLDGRTPHQLLDDFGQGDKQAGELFREYAAAFKGRAQLVASTSMRDKHDKEGNIIAEGLIRAWGVSWGADRDEELAAELAEGASDAPMITELADEQFKVIVQADKLAEVLQIAESQSFDDLWLYLYSIGVPQVESFDIRKAWEAP